MCGEHCGLRGVRFKETGSSPHVRGTLEDEAAVHELRGIIPACAGNTSGHGLGCACGRDHPRMCGEHCTKSCPTSSGLGSSPHVRGTLSRLIMRWGICGIIPACAGNTDEKMIACLHVGDHPRMCGEHLSAPFTTTLSIGSSPHVRGTPAVLHEFLDVVGIIPACAGNTALDGGKVMSGGDHPRMCGEHLLDEPVHVDALWIIPACAGNTIYRKR